MLKLRTITLISHASKVMLKILQARLQQYVNCELPDVQAGFRKGRGTRDQIADIRWIIEKAREFHKNIYFCFVDYTKAFDCVDHNKLQKILFIFLLYNIVLVLPYFNMNPPWVYMCSPSWNPLPPSSPSHPSRSSQCTRPEHPVSCIEPGLVICFTYDIIHVSVPFSQIIPPFPSPTEFKRLFYTSLSLLLSCIQGYRYHLSKFHMYVLVYCIGVFLSGLLHSV